MSRMRILLGLALVAAWSSGFIGAELGTRSAPASTLLAWRYVVATAAFALLLLVLRRRWPRRDATKHAAIGLLCQGVYLGGVVGGVGLGVPPGTAALVAAGQPLVVAALEHLLLGRTTTRAQRAGLILGLAGVALVVSSDIGRGEAAAWAYLLPLGGMLGLSLGTVLDRRWDLDAGVLEGLTVQTAVVAVLIVGGAATTGTLAPPATTAFWTAVVWVVALSTFGGYGLYFAVLRRSGATAVSSWLYLTPPATMLWAALAFGDRPGPLAIGGTAVCAAAVCLAVGGSTHRPRATNGHPSRRDPALRVPTVTSPRNQIRGQKEKSWTTSRPSSSAPGRPACRRRTT
jgi:drug/metabolite transporter (DMT)-like permease